MPGERHDLVVVGAGPAGLSAAVHAHDEGMSYRLIERSEHLADTVHCYQKRKLVMAEPGLVPLRSPLPFAAGSREEILAGWAQAAETRDLAIDLGCGLVGLERVDDGFVLEVSGREPLSARSVVLALGTQGNPRRLGVEGEDQAHVVNRLVDPDDFSDRQVVVVGAGDSAIEIALALADTNRVHLIVRKPEIVRAKESLERSLLTRANSGAVTIHFSTTVRSIGTDSVELTSPEGVVTVAADTVIVKIGAEPPRRLFTGWGIELTGDGDDAQPKLSPHYETSVPGLYLIGAAAGRDLIKLGINQGFEVIEHLLGRQVVPADEDLVIERMPWWSGPAGERLESLRDEIPLLSHASESQLRETLLSTQPKEFAPGEVILRQNDYTDSFLVIVDGAVDISVKPEGAGAKQPPRQVARLLAGNFFGEMSLISGRRRNATATVADESEHGTTTKPTRLLEIPRKAMLKLLAVAPAVAASLDRTFMIRAFQGYLFPDVPDNLLWELAARASQRRLDKGEEIFREGEPGDAIHLIRSGKMKIAKRSGDKEIVLNYLEAGTFFGESALLSDSPRTATVSAIFPSEIISIARQDFERFLAVHPEEADGFRAKLEQRRIASLIAEATPGTGNVLSELIREEVIMGTDALIIDEHKCVRCNNCIEACRGVHDDGQARLSLTGIRFYNLLAPNSCWQCEDPLCMLDCPPDALVRQPNGEIYIKSNCIGCGNCADNCPYDNIFMVHPEPEPTLGDWVRSIFGIEKGSGEAAEVDESTVAVKCDLCADLGNDPACVRSCPTGAAIRLEPDEYRRTLEDLVVRRGEV